MQATVEDRREEREAKLEAREEKNIRVEPTSEARVQKEIPTASSYQNLNNSVQSINPNTIEKKKPKLVLFKKDENN